MQLKTFRHGVKNSLLWLADVFVMRQPRAPLLLLKLAERTHTLFVTQHPEPAEVVNVILAISWILPLALNPNYLQTSVYLREIAKHFTREQCLAAFLVLFCYWLCCLAFGGPPSALIKNSGHLARWTCLRIGGLVAAVFVWLSVAQMLTMNGITTTSVVFAGGAAWSAGVFLLLSWRVILEKEIRWAKQGKTRKGVLVKAGR